MEAQKEPNTSSVETLSKLAEHRVQFSELEFQDQDTSGVQRSMQEIIESNPNLLNTPTNESQTLTLFFLSRYAKNVLPEETIANFQSNLQKLREQYTLIPNIENGILQIQDEAKTFFMNEEARHQDERRNFRIKLPPNPIASLILETEANLIQSRYRTYKPLKQFDYKYDEPPEFTPKVEGDELDITMTKKFKS